MIYPVGQRVTGTVNNINDLGIFVTLDSDHYGLVHHRDFGKGWLLARRRYAIGQRVRVVVDRRTGRRIGLSLTRVADPDLPDPTNNYRGLAARDFERVLNKLVRHAEQANRHFAKIIKKDV